LGIVVFGVSLSTGLEQALQISKHARTHQDQAGEKSEKQSGPTMAKQSCRCGASESEAEVFQFLDPRFVMFVKFSTDAFS
jgi:hypothetical protein